MTRQIMGVGESTVHDVDGLRARIVELEAEVERGRRLASQLDVTRSRLDAVLSALPVVLWETDQRGIITTNQGHGLALLGMRAGDMVGASVREVYVDSPEILACMERGLKGETFSVSNQVAGIRFENHYLPQRAPDGTVVGLLGLTLVVTLHKEAEAQLQEAEAQLQHKQKQESLAVLAGGIAHDFNNLLVGSLGNADLALRLVPDDSSVAGHLREIIRSSERAGDLCRQLLAYAGRGQFIVKVVDLNQLVEDSMHLIELAIAKTSVLHAELTPKLPRVRGDATQLVQVLINLIKNASDAAEGKPSTISIRTGVRFVAPDELRLTVVAPDAKAGDYVFVSVRDDGVGMSKEVLSRIFDPFFSTKQTGRGLGLAAVVGIVRSHGGMLEVESEAGVGTNMVVYLPVTQQQEPSPSQPARSTRAHLANATILVVDDEAAARSVARAMLEQAGCTVIEASNGREAVELFVRHRTQVDAVLMDLSMPVLGGAAAMRELLEIDRDVKVVLVSGYAEHDTGSDLAGLRPAAFLHKPYRYDQLLDLLSSALPSRA